MHGDASRLERHERTGRYGFARYLVDALPRFPGLCAADVEGSATHGYIEPDLPQYRLKSVIMYSGKLVLICVILRAWY